VSGDHVEIELSPTLPPADGSWGNYAITVRPTHRAQFPGPLRGRGHRVRERLPPAAGLSSSSALVVATFLASRT
jgi:galactokinase